MTRGRPEILFPLFAKLVSLKGIGLKIASILETFGVQSPGDLLFVLPHSVVDRRLRRSISDLTFPEVVTVPITVGAHQPPRQKGRPYRVQVEDDSRSFQLVFFHAREDWIERILPRGEQRIVSGKVELFDGVAQMAHPDHIVGTDAADTLPKFEPVYPLTAGVSLKVMRRAIVSALECLPELDEWIDPNLVQDKSWLPWRLAVEQAHAPERLEDVSPSAPARERLAYDEFLAHQLTLAIARAKERRQTGIVMKPSGKLQKKMLDLLSFEPTHAQTRAVAEIVEDLREPRRMNRLLQGDVGSGKTLVAALVAVATAEAGGQSVLMAPTGILAHQHFAALKPLIEGIGLRIGLLTGRDKGKERDQKLEALIAGEIDLLIGTHALFQKGVEFKSLRLAIVDEQHRFGVRQRMDLGAKGDAVDILVMTATPIPRSLELANYGDMDVSVLDEKPSGRTPIDTVLVNASRVDEVIARLKNAVAEGRQAYWVCPLVAESEVYEATAAEARFKSLRANFPEGNVSLVHGQMSPAEKDAAMAAFVSGEAQVLVATTVIEVGVDVPNASIMIIEDAEKFGLSQLHQLRGRVGRGAVKSTCLLIHDGELGETAAARLKIMRETNDGFKIAEEDLALRGAGDVLGVAQSGLPRFRIGDLESQTGLMKVAQSDARALLATDPQLTSERGRAARVLLYLMRQDDAFKLLSVG